MKSYLYLLLYFVALVTCVARYRSFKQLRYKLFVPLLVAIVLYEYSYMRKWLFINNSTLWSANIEITMEYVFYCFFIVSSFRSPKERQGFSIAAWAIFIFTIIDILFIQGIARLCNIAIVLQYALLIVMVCRFFYGQLKMFDGEASLLRHPDFWVNTGLLFFSLSEFLFFSAFSLAYTPSRYFSILFDVITAVANITLYSCLIIAFLCHPRSRKLSLS